MVSLLDNKKYDLTVIIEYFHKNKSIENIIKIFSVFTKKIYLIKLNQKLIRFHLKSLPLIRKIILEIINCHITFIIIT